jgi:peptidoglycan hydrolase CwlO-like protein
MDKGEWDTADYKYEKAKQLNDIRRKEIEIEKLNIKKEEIALEIDNINLSIGKYLEEIETNKKSIKWCEDKI